MTHTKRLTTLLVTLLLISPGTAISQFDPGEKPVSIFEILDSVRNRLGIVIVAGSSDRGYEAGNEYWRFSEDALLSISDQESLTIAPWAQGDWDNPWIVGALAWQPDDTSVEWSHPAEAEWTPQDEARPPIVPGGTYFGNATLGGLTIQYSTRGESSLTWFKLTEGDFMLLEDGAVFRRDTAPPTTGSWWYGPIME